MRLAREIVAFIMIKGGVAAEEEFKSFSEKDLPSEIAEKIMPKNCTAFANFYLKPGLQNQRPARRLVEGGE